MARTTLTVDDHLLHDLKEIAHRSGKPLKEVVNETLEAGLDARKSPRRSRRYRLQPVSMGSPRPGIDLDKALSLADSIEEQEIARKLELRK